MHRGTGWTSPQEFGVADANANCPPIFKKMRSEFTKTRHFEQQIHFFLGYPSIDLFPVDPSPCPNRAFWIRLYAPRIPGKFTPLGRFFAPHLEYGEGNCIGDSSQSRDGQFAINVAKRQEVAMLRHPRHRVGGGMGMYLGRFCP